MIITPIHQIQGDSPWSPIAGQTVRTQGIVTGHARRGFFIQDPNPLADPNISDAVFVYSPKKKPPSGSYLELESKVIDYRANDNGKPVTQLRMIDGKLLDERGPTIEAFVLSAKSLPLDPEQLTIFLNGLEGMLLTIETGATFIQASNPFGDYVVSLADDDLSEFRTMQGGIRLDTSQTERWFPSFRMIDYDNAPLLNVGAKLLGPVTGPLNYRSSSYQIAVNHPITIEHAQVRIEKTTLKPSAEKITLLTLNGFNLDAHIESAENVKNPRTDIDDDLGDGRFHSLAEAIVSQAASPDIIALQEIQDSDGAEISTQVGANETYEIFIKIIKEIGGPDYQWVDIAPKADSDGGQPGGNIRNAYLYNKDRITLKANSVTRLGETEAAFEGSRKPLVAHFNMKGSDYSLAVINVHLASKRHQNSIFSPNDPGVDPQEITRIQQASIVRNELVRLSKKGIDYFVTGDFNDFDDSLTLKAMLGDESINLVKTLPPLERYDYNHRGKLHVLMHGIVSKQLAMEERAEYEILHGNELIGVKPGELGTKPSDHAYVITRIKMR